MPAFLEGQTALLILLTNDDGIYAPGLAALEQMLGDPATGRFCHGDQLTMADLCLVPQVFNARRWGVDLAPLLRITAIDAALAALPAVQMAHPTDGRDERPFVRAGPGRSAGRALPSRTHPEYFGQDE